MPIEFNCPGCARRLRLPDEYAGQRGKCPACETLFDTPIAAPPVQAPLPPSRAMPPAVLQPAGPDPWASFAESLTQPKPQISYSDPTNPFAAPSATGYAPPQRVGESAKNFGIASATLGAMALGLNTFGGCCCAFFVVPGLALSVIGIVLACYSTGNMRMTGLVLNCLSLAVVFAWIVLFVVLVVAQPH